MKIGKKVKDENNCSAGSSRTMHKLMECFYWSVRIRNATSGTFCTVVKSKIAHKAYNKDV